MTDARYEIRETKDSTGEIVAWHFVLIAENGEVVESSEQYTRREDAERGIEAAARAAASVGKG